MEKRVFLSKRKKQKKKPGHIDLMANESKIPTGKSK